MTVSEPARPADSRETGKPTALDGPPMARKEPTTGRTLLGAALGAIIGTLLFIVPGSTVLGGAVAGYAGGGSNARTAATGALAGAFMFVPAAIVVTGFGGVVLPGEWFAGAAVGVVLAAMAVYTVALAAVGGLVGGYVARADRLEVSASTAGAGSPLWHGVIGGIVAIVLSFIPYSTVLGGAVAGYLEGGTLRDGAVVGAIAGIVALVPLTVVALFLLGVFGLFAGLAGVAAGLLVVLVLAVGLVYTVGLGVVGGVVGAYLADRS